MTATDARSGDAPLDLGPTVGAALTLVAAHQAGLLAALLTEPGEPRAYAARLGLDERATERVLDLLAACGVATRAGDGYTASPAYRDWAARVPLGVDGFFALWGTVPAFLRRGEHFGQFDGEAPQRDAAYTDVVASLGRRFAGAADFLAVQLEGAPARILDVGAGSGVWSLAMAAHDPGARVTALDLPQVLSVFAEHARARDLAARVDTLPGDYHTVALPVGHFDRAVLANVLHLEPPERAAALLARVAAALRPGGQLVVVDVLGDDTPAGERARALYALHLALRTEHGAPHPLGALRGWAVEAGLEPRAMLPLPGGPAGLGAFVARRAGRREGTP